MKRLSAIIALILIQTMLVWGADITLPVDTAVVVPVNILAIVTKADPTTKVEDVAYDQAGMDLIWNFVTAAGATSATTVTPTTSGVYDWSHGDGGMYKIEIPASGGGSINNDTEGVGFFSGETTAHAPWRGPTIKFTSAAQVAAEYGTGYAEVNAVQVAGGTPQDADDVVDAWEVQSQADASGFHVNVKLVSDDATAADNLESAADNYSVTRGLAGTALPAAAADAAGGIPISDAGGLDLDALDASVGAILDDTGTDGVQIANDGITAAKVAANAFGASELATDAANEIVDAWETQSQTDPTGFHINVKEFNGTAVTARDIGASVLLSSGTGTGQVALSSGKVDVGLIEGVDATNTIDARLTAYDAVVPADLPTNFADLSITVTTGRVDVAAIAGTAQTANDNGADINAILVDTGTTLNDYVDDLETRLTATRAGYLDELGPTNMPADLDAVLTDTGTTLDGIVDAILVDTGTTLPATLTTIAGYVDTEVAAILADTGTDGVVVASGQSFSVSELQASALADLFNTDSGTDYASSVAGSAVKEMADNAGGSALTVEAIRAEIDSNSTQLAAIVEDTGTDIPTSIAALPTAVEIQAEMEENGASTLDTIADAIASGTYGLSAIEGLVDDLETRLTAARAGYLDELGPTNIPADVDAILTDTGTTLDGYVDDLEGRLTATRAGYLDELGPTNIPADVDAVLADTGTAGVVVAAGSKTGYSLAADQSAVTVGTVNALAANSVTASVLATDAVNELMAAIAAQVVDGTVTVAQLRKILLAIFVGETAGAGTGTLQFFRQDGTTIELQNVYDVNGNRVTGTIEP